MTSQQKARPATVGEPETADGYPLDLERVLENTIHKQAGDLLLQACARNCRLLSRKHSLRNRLRGLCAVTRHCRELGSSDVVHAEMLEFCHEMNLIADLGPTARKDCDDTIRRALAVCA